MISLLYKDLIFFFNFWFLVSLFLFSMGYNMFYRLRNIAITLHNFINVYTLYTVMYIHAHGNYFKWNMKHWKTFYFINFFWYKFFLYKSCNHLILGNTVHVFQYGHICCINTTGLKQICWKMSVTFLFLILIMALICITVRNLLCSEHVFFFN